MKVEDFVQAGLRCPSCHSDKLRSGYHEWQIWDSWICENCGFRWMEDISPSRFEEKLMQILKEETPKQQKQRLIWVLHKLGSPSHPLKNPRSSDEGSYETFIKGQ